MESTVPPTTDPRPQGVVVLGKCVSLLVRAAALSLQEQPLREDSEEHTAWKAAAQEFFEEFQDACLSGAPSGLVGKLARDAAAEVVHRTSGDCLAGVDTREAEELPLCSDPEAMQRRGQTVSTGICRCVRHLARAASYSASEEGIPAEAHSAYQGEVAQFVACYKELLPYGPYGGCIRHTAATILGEAIDTLVAAAYRKLQEGETPVPSLHYGVSEEDFYGTPNGGNLNEQGGC